VIPLTIAGTIGGIGHPKRCAFLVYAAFDAPRPLLCVGVGFALLVDPLCGHI